MIRKRTTLASKIQQNAALDTASPKKGLAALLNNKAQIVPGMYAGSDAPAVLKTPMSPASKSKLSNADSQMYMGLQGGLLGKTALQFDENLLCAQPFVIQKDVQSKDAPEGSCGAAEQAIPGADEVELIPAIKALMEAHSPKRQRSFKSLVLRPEDEMTQRDVEQALQPPTQQSNQTNIGPKQRAPMVDWAQLNQLHRRCWELELRSRTQSLRSQEQRQRRLLKRQEREEQQQALQRAGAEKEERIAQLRMQLGELREQQQQQQAEARALEQRGRELEAMVASQEGDIEGLRLRSGQYQEELSAHVRRLAQLEAEQERQSEAAARGRAAVAELEEEQGRLRGEVGAKKRALEEAEERAEGLKRSYFNAIALAIKIDLSLKRDVSCDATINLQELFEAASAQRVTPAEYPSWIAKQIEAFSARSSSRTTNVTPQQQQQQQLPTKSVSSRRRN